MTNVKVEVIKDFLEQAPQIFDAIRKCQAVAFSNYSSKN
jgi:hypothetical protein